MSIYLLELGTKINQGAANLNIFIRAHDELTGLANYSKIFAENVQATDKTIEYPQNDLRRIAELADNIANQSQSAAAIVASAGNPVKQINQIQRNLPALQKIIDQLIPWLEKTMIMAK